MSDDQKRDDGGQAFPTLEVRQDWDRDSGFGGVYSVGEEGMTLRDWFAGQALAGFTSDSDLSSMVQQAADKVGLAFSQVLAHQAYAMADAMLAERAK